MLQFLTEKIEKFEKILEVSNDSRPADVNKEPEDAPVKLHPQGTITMLKSVLDGLRQKSKSASIFAINLLPYVFTFEEIYRRTLKNASTDATFPKIGIDSLKLNEILASTEAQFKKSFVAATVRRDLGNHLGLLNKLFKRIRDGETASTALYKEIGLQKAHLVFQNMSDHFKNPAKMAVLDLQINQLVNESLPKKTKRPKKADEPTTEKEHDVFDEWIVNEMITDENRATSQRHLNSLPSSAELFDHSATFTEQTEDGEVIQHPVISD